MSFLARIAALAAAALTTVLAYVWEGGRWILRAVKSATGVATPILPSTDAATAYLDAPAPAVAPAPYQGPAPRHQVGVPLVSYAPAPRRRGTGCGHVHPPRARHDVAPGPVSWRARDARGIAAA